ncbi:MAG: hypothetical protein Q4F35_04605 [Akkermansia sp.]|nr:hypothetical protein [Akkermansia sp.]
MNGRRGIYNILVGFVSEAIIIALGIIVPRLFLTSFGSEYNGLLNTVGQAFAYLVLLEAGVGGASIQALYAAISKGDKNDISSIVVATDYYYKKTGIFYAISVVILAICFPLFVESTIPTLTIIGLILLAGVPGVIRYIFQGKYTVLLVAEGKNYIVSTFNTLTHVVVVISKVIFLLAGCSIMAFQVYTMLFSLLSVLLIYIYMKKNYKWIDYSAKPNFQAMEQKNAVLVGQISDLAFRNSSILILAFFYDLKVASVYAIFNMLFSMVRTALDTIGKGVAHIMGQTYNADKDLYLKYHDTYETYRMSLIFCLYAVALIFIIPFMRLYTEGVTDINYLDYNVAVLFVVTSLLSAARACEADLINYAQHFRKTQWRCVAEAVINIVTALILTPIWGIYGVMMATAIALLYRANDMIIYANRIILKRSPWITYKRLIINSIVFVTFIRISNYIPWSLDSYISIIGCALITTSCALVIFWGIASLFDKASFMFICKFLNKKITSA